MQEDSEIRQSLCTVSHDNRFRSDIVNGYDAGADDYITKPFSLMVLVSKVQAFMRRMEGVCGHNRNLIWEISSKLWRNEALKRNADGVAPLTLSKRTSDNDLLYGKRKADFIKRTDFRVCLGC